MTTSRSLLGALLLLAAAACGGEGRPALDAGASTSVSPVLTDDSLYCAAHPTCTSDADLFVEGESPYGSLELSDLSVDYLVGDTVGTRLTFTGSTDGRPFLLVVRLLSDLEPDGRELPVSPAGRYFADRATILRTLPDGSCAVDELSVDAEVLEHVAPETPALGDRLVLGATLRGAGAGWKLDIELEARKACGTTRDR